MQHYRKWDVNILTECMNGRRPRYVFLPRSSLRSKIFLKPFISDVSRRVFWESIFHARTLLQATLALSLVVSSLKSVCSHFSIFSAVMPRSPACPLFNLVRNSVVQSPSSVIRDPRYGNVSTCSSLSVCAVGAGAVGCVRGVGSVYRRVNVCLSHVSAMIGSASAN